MPVLSSGGKQVLETGTVISFSGEPIEIDVPTLGRVMFLFAHDPSLKPSMNIVPQAHGGAGITLNNFTGQATGTCTRDPVAVCDVLMQISVRNPPGGCPELSYTFFKPAATS